MNFSLLSMLYVSTVVATAIAGFGPGGLFFAATCLAVWRLAFPGQKKLPGWAEKLLALFVVFSLGVTLVFVGLMGLQGWSFDPKEYDISKQVCSWIFIAVALAPALIWFQPREIRRPDEEIELPEEGEGP